MAGIFKSYDIRGLWNRDWNAATARRIGRLLPELLGAREIVVGRDVRTSSPEVFAALAAGLRAAGCAVADIGICDTPATYFATAHYGFDGGIMITASHNPPEYNGLKVSARGAVPFGYDDGLDRLERAVGEQRARADEPLAPSAEAAAVRRLDIRADYRAYLERYREGIGSRKVVVDYSNGTGSVYFPGLLAGLPLQVIPLFDRPDGSFPNHPPNPLVEDNLAALKARVLAERADLGICFDGDADRVMFVDERGRFVSADLLIGLLARYYFAMHPERLAGASRVVSIDVRSSRGVEEHLRELGAEPRVCRVGHVFAKRLLRETGAICGGELAGHYYFREHACCDSGFAAALIVLAVLSAEGRPLSALASEIGRYAFSGEINFAVPDGAALVERIRAAYPAGRLSSVDGIRLDFPTWWFNLRVSNTEPLVRLVLEAETPAELARRTADLVARIGHPPVAGH